MQTDFTSMLTPAKESIRQLNQEAVALLSTMATLKSQLGAISSTRGMGVYDKILGQGGTTDQAFGLASTHGLTREDLENQSRYIKDYEVLQGKYKDLLGTKQLLTAQARVELDLQRESIALAKDAADKQATYAREQIAYQQKISDERIQKQKMYAAMFDEQDRKERNYTSGQNIVTRTLSRNEAAQLNQDVARYSLYEDQNRQARQRNIEYNNAYQRQPLERAEMQTEYEQMFSGKPDKNGLFTRNNLGTGSYANMRTARMVGLAARAGGLGPLGYLAGMGLLEAPDDVLGSIGKVLPAAFVGAGIAGVAAGAYTLQTKAIEYDAYKQNLNAAGQAYGTNADFMWNHFIGSDPKAREKAIEDSNKALGTIVTDSRRANIEAGKALPTYQNVRVVYGARQYENILDTIPDNNESGFPTSSARSFVPQFTGRTFKTENTGARSYAYGITDEQTGLVNRMSVSERAKFAEEIGKVSEKLNNAQSAAASFNHLLGPLIEKLIAPQRLIEDIQKHTQTAFFTTRTQLTKEAQSAEAPALGDFPTPRERADAELKAINARRREQQFLVSPEYARIAAESRSIPQLAGVNRLYNATTLGISASLARDTESARVQESLYGIAAPSGLENRSGVLDFTRETQLRLAGRTNESQLAGAFADYRRQSETARIETNTQLSGVVGEGTPEEQGAKRAKIREEYAKKVSEIEIEYDKKVAQSAQELDNQRFKIRNDHTIKSAELAKQIEDQQAKFGLQNLDTNYLASSAIVRAGLGTTLTGIRVGESQQNTAAQRQLFDIQARTALRRATALPGQESTLLGQEFGDASQSANVRYNRAIGNLGSRETELIAQSVAASKLGDLDSARIIGRRDINRVQQGDVQANQQFLTDLSRKGSLSIEDKAKFSDQFTLIAEEKRVASEQRVLEIAQARLAYEEKIGELVKGRIQVISDVAGKVWDNLTSGAPNRGYALQQSLRQYGLGLGGQIVKNTAVEAFHGFAEHLPDAFGGTDAQYDRSTDKPTFLGRVLSGTPFAANPAKSLVTAGDEKIVFAVNNVTTAIRSLGGVGGVGGPGSSGASGYGGGTSGDFNYNPADGNVDLGGSQGDFNINPDMKGSIYGGGSSGGSGGGSTASIGKLAGLFKGASNPSSVFEALGLYNGDGSSAHGLSTSEAIGAGVGAAATLFAGYEGVKSGLSKGGGKGITQAIGSAAGTAAVLDPETVSKTILAGVAAVSGLVSALFGDPRAARAELISQTLGQDKYNAPLALNKTTSTDGSQIAYDYTGRVVKTGFSSRYSVQEPFQAGGLIRDQYGNYPYETLPGHDTGGYGPTTGVSTSVPITQPSGGPGATSIGHNVTINVSTMDSKSFNDNAHALAGAVRIAMRDGHGINDQVIKLAGRSNS